MTTLRTALRRPAAYTLVLCLAVVLGSSVGCGGGSGNSGDDIGDGNGDVSPTLQVTSANFAANGTIPLAHVRTVGCGGGDTTPQLSWTWTPAAPGTVQGYAVVVADTTVPWTHWILFNIPASTTSLPQIPPPPAPLPPGLPPGLIEGPNTWGNSFYEGPCPPAGTGTHTYVFTVWALSVADVTALPGYAAVAADPVGLRNLIEANSIASGSHAGTRSP